MTYLRPYSLSPKLSRDKRRNVKMKRKNFYLVSVLAIAVFVAGLFVFFPNEKDSSVEEN